MIHFQVSGGSLSFVFSLWSFSLLLFLLRRSLTLLLRQTWNSVCSIGLELISILWPQPLRYQDLEQGASTPNFPKLFCILASSVCWLLLLILELHINAFMQYKFFCAPTLSLNRIYTPSIHVSVCSLASSFHCPPCTPKKSSIWSSEDFLSRLSD